MRQGDLSHTRHLTVGHQQFRSASNFGSKEVPLFLCRESTTQQLPHGILWWELVTGEAGFGPFAEMVFALVDEVDCRPITPEHLHSSADAFVLIADDRLGLAW